MKGVPTPGGKEPVGYPVAASLPTGILEQHASPTPVHSCMGKVRLGYLLLSTLGKILPLLLTHPGGGEYTLAHTHTDRQTDTGHTGTPGAVGSAAPGEMSQFS